MIKIKSRRILIFIIGVVLFVFLAVISLVIHQYRLDGMFRPDIICNDIILAVGDSEEIKYRITAAQREDHRTDLFKKYHEKYEEKFQKHFAGATVEFINHNPDLVNINDNVITGFAPGETEIEILIWRKYEKQPLFMKYRNIEMISTKIQIKINEQNTIFDKEKIY